MKPPQRKNTPPILSEGPFKRGEVDCIRRNYEDGTVDLMIYDESRRLWIAESYSAQGTEDFERVLASPVLSAIYLKKIGVFSRKEE